MKEKIETMNIEVPMRALKERREGLLASEVSSAMIYKSLALSEHILFTSLSSLIYYFWGILRNDES